MIIFSFFGYALKKCFKNIMERRYIADSKLLEKFDLEKRFEGQKT